MPLRRAKVLPWYAGRCPKVGDRIEIEEEHIEVLLMAGAIEPEEGEPGYVPRAFAKSKQKAAVAS